jgi:redox-sensitive bicupin YhaK (pirin superfamily)
MLKATAGAAAAALPLGAMRAGSMTEAATITIRKAKDRGHANHGWLDTWHTFSFADYHDPNHMGFRSLRVINEDWIDPSKGFGTHPHRDMEILTYVLEGSLQHKDSMGNGSMIVPSEVQRMSAGTGVHHSEFNPSDKEKVHLLQIWIRPDRDGVTPGYAQKTFPRAERLNRLRVVASRDGRDGSISIHQDATLLAAILEPKQAVRFDVANGRHAWIQVARGEIKVNGQTLVAGDGASSLRPGSLEIAASKESEILLFDLA